MIIIMLFLLRWRTADFPAHADRDGNGTGLFMSFS